ncbi:adenosine deaminase domain-containing protein 1 [Xiphophorus hellerii]|uniref:adenosine deaminase domain-containing protein 1 n=1 Tax=Xiphophorus hellerii TaxID=8084 RepID=UPI0013B3F247|nr:adenosine deaminase domain-containing protein 1 [Xiphophorus hellerii]XP_032410169.1 adenosine deaminase domain-containing protein 1 [Xiphophorus hellerii]
MFSAGGSFRGSRGTSFAQILMKSLPPTSESRESNKEQYFFNVDQERDSIRQGTKSFRPGHFEKPKSSPKELVEKYKKGETNAVSLLHQLAQVLQFHLEIKETVTTGNLSGFYFAFAVEIDGVQYKTGMGVTKKEARLNAAKAALEDFLPSLGCLKSDLPQTSDVPPPLPVKEDASISDRNPSRAFYERKSSVNLQIPHAVKDQLSKLLNNHPEFSSCGETTAAFIVKTSTGCEVVALGTGNFNTKVSSNGRVVHDSHAVVTARRSLMRYLYRHLLMYFSKNANLTAKSIFTHNINSKLLSLKSGITLHLYVNQLPKGAAQIPTKLRLNPFSITTWQVNSEISLHLSVEGKVFSVFSSTLDNSASEMVSMSTTDKITQWQVLGYQGALLSHFIEPVYVQSILVGDSGCTEIRGMEMSVNQRVEGITSLLPMFYCMMRPHISLVPSVVTSDTGSQLTCGINWCEGDGSVEVVDGLEGKTIEESPFKSGPALASRLCKAAMLHRFRLVAKEAQRQDLVTTSCYRELKMMAKPYQEAKSVLRAYLSQQGFGSWLEKLPGSDNFND